MRYLALALVAVLAVAPLCPADVINVTGTLAPATSTQNTFDVVCELTIDAMGFLVTASDSDVATTSGTSRFQLDCTFNETTNAVSSLNGIKFLYGDGASDPGPLDFDDVSFTLNYVLYGQPIGALNVWSTNLAGSNSTGRQENWPASAGQDPALIPFVPVNGSGEFLLDTDTTPGSDMLLYLSQGTFDISGLSVYTWDLAASEAWNDGKPMPGSGTVSVATPSISGTVATYDVDVSIPIVSAFPVWNPVSGGVPNPLGYVTATGTMVMSGQFTRTVEVHVPIMGDANDDGVVDDEDASILGANWLLQSGATWGDGDFNTDGKVDDKDAAIMAAHWGTPAEGASVPEPSTAVLLLGLALAGLTTWRRR